MDLVMVTATMFLVVSLTAFQVGAADLEHTKDSLDTVKAMLEEKKAVLVDVRELDEWEEGHVKDAIHLPLREMMEKKVDVAKLKDKLPKDKIIYTYCAAGVRSLRSGKIIVEFGYEVRPLKPGFEALSKAGFPTEKK